MSEWTIVTVLIALIGLFITVGRPIINLNTTMVELRKDIQTIRDDLVRSTKSNEEEHKEIYESLEKHSEELIDHDKRITVLESK